MTQNQLAVVRQSHNSMMDLGMEETYRLGQILADSNYFSDAKGAAQAMAKILMGRELGIGPMASLTQLHVIQGKPTISANLMASAIKGSGKYTYRVIEHDETVCEIDFFEGSERIGNSRFTVADAKRNLTKNMDKFPKNMLFARAISNGQKWHCPDVFNSVVYVPEELGAAVDSDGHAVGEETAATHPNKDVAWIEKNGVKDAPYKMLHATLKYFKDSSTTHDMFDEIYEQFNTLKAQRSAASEEPAEPEVHEGEVEDTPDLSTDAQRKLLYVLAGKVYGKKSDEQIHKLIENPDGTPRSTKDLTKVEISGLIDSLQNQIDNPPADLNDRVHEKMVDAKITNKVDALRAKARKLKEDITEEELLGQYNAWLGSINEQPVGSLEDSTVELLTMGAAMIGGNK